MNDKDLEKNESLPKPVVNQEVPTGMEFASDIAGSKSVELASSKPAQLANPSQLAASTATTQNPLMALQDDDAAAPLTAGMPQIADDADLIEKEWISKAKSIIQENRFDPRTQNSELSKVKAAYVKRRFDKDIKLKAE
jgi:hypothetical protein